jgi:hypothetical protein
MNIKMSPERSAILEACKEAKGITEFASAWEGLFASVFGSEMVTFMKRNVAELLILAQDMFSGPQEAFTVSAATAHALGAAGCQSQSSINLCCASLYEQVCKGYISPSDSADLISDWFHCYYTYSQKEIMAAKGLTEADVRRLQKEVNQKSREAHELANSVNDAAKGLKAMPVLSGAEERKPKIVGVHTPRKHEPGSNKSGSGLN